jgi:hypothetical protein
MVFAVNALVDPLSHARFEAVEAPSLLALVERAVCKWMKFVIIAFVLSFSTVIQARRPAETRRSTVSK